VHGIFRIPHSAFRISLRPCGVSMISRLRGVIREIGDQRVLLEVQGVCYDVLMPASLLRAAAERAGQNRELELVTFHYHQLEVGRGVPVLIGFFNEVEREFFTRFISVSGVGPRAALKALTQPIALIAQAIDQGDLSLLRSLPGIGEQRAKEIVAKLQGKVGKFGLIQSQAPAPEPADSGETTLEDEAVAVLVQLEYKKHEAKEMVRAALKRNPSVKSSEDLLNEVYRQRRPAHAETAA
jgi:Holliday junction DNA helicase RuvA